MDQVPVVLKNRSSNEITLISDDPAPNTTIPIFSETLSEDRQTDRKIDSNPMLIRFCFQQENGKRSEVYGH